VPFENAADETEAGRDLDQQRLVWFVLASNLEFSGKRL
jgi:hypothetical protein